MDHPRSRGVYLRCISISAICLGSSPLARGLRPNEYQKEIPEGIIPARAGFTSPSCAARTGRWDHPRSRGVYRDITWNNPLREGSSPLARGLLRPLGAHCERVGIIPARAGFTKSPSSSESPAPDHPRSRGVYSVIARTRLISCGSSPLARGLLPMSVRGGNILVDHPRSRGVYTMTLPSGRIRDGSSPLARGLRRDNLVRTLLRRIIPARAGFTTASPPRSGTHRDHPRSRGVYVPEIRTVSPAFGSSPLARGLHRRHHPLPGGPGIIPARAGFTLTTGTTAASPPDHPRSRGVYGGL